MFKCGVRPEVAMLGEDGNAFSILGRCRRAARRAGVPADEITEFFSEATTGDYDHVLATVMEYFEC